MGSRRSGTAPSAEAPSTPAPSTAPVIPPAAPAPEILDRSSVPPFEPKVPMQGVSGAVNQPSPAEGVAFFEKKIRPVPADKCYECHTANTEKIKGGLVLDTRDGMRRGGDNGPAVVPGKPAESLLLAAFHYANKDFAMPPQKSGGKLPDEVIKDFEKWVQMGAPDRRRS